ncbi:adenylate cyclase [Plasticicumulans lactativorans]|uniref:Adenylate cyclase n=1 Tax=Plasticicumulans lactativorans TaxID=1133106 RepID=A0A4R2L0N4_9GAMM|nr:adenylate/guanylate cyclase domain-containing protein [Plasticicumulans lactativorans]TCO80571.1 adenylate cyclase [Plasticicumulans lactativorans]
MSPSLVARLRLHFPPRAAPLPARLAAMIRTHRDSSERLIGWVQLGVVATFGSLWAVAPKPPHMSELMPVPWTLTAYLAFTLARLAWTRRHALPDWAAHLSIVADFTLLYGLIWSFHLQYGQPPSFYLKAPTLLYVFIFITLRVLCFEPRFVVFAGLCAAGGWLGMLAYAIGGDPHAAVITRDYVHYLTSNAVLLGGEFDKVITVLTVTAILAIAVTRAQHLLERSVIESNAARELARFLPMAVAVRIAAAAERPETGAGELRPATILFLDVEGFTSLAEALAPTRLIALLNEVFQAVVEPIERHGGVVDQFIGDAVMATFNLPQALPDHAACACRAALEVQALLERRRFGDGVRLRARIGINSGVVVGGLVGAGERLAYTVYGDAVNLAARLEPLNKDYDTRILVSEATRRAAGDPAGLAFRPVGEVQVRGRTELTSLYTLEPVVVPAAGPTR